MAEIDTLLEIMRRLRAAQGGCPWDRQQTFATLVPHTLEEAYEVADAIDCGASEKLKDELGDLLFQVVFYCQIAAEGRLFDFDAVVAGITSKLVRRHPHVFGSAIVEDAAAQALHWEDLKAVERGQAGNGQNSELDDLPRALPALTRAHKLQKRAARVGFDWAEVAPIRAKVVEELDELMDAVARRELTAVSEELGDLLFACVNLSRHLQVDPESALRAANAKFERRFRYIEKRLDERHLRIEHMTLAELDALWDEAKTEGL